ncbi:MAG: short-chain dehydrogenase [Novosphingobium sp.]|nr:short-chain dehydrogenase [Novosphingobium sp.]
MGRLKGKVAVVTGASGGIGLAIARLYAREGASVVISARRGELVRNAAEELVSQGGHAIAVEADVAIREDARRTIAAAVEAFGTVDILVNNAQATRQAAIQDITEDSIRLTFGSGLFGTLFHMQEAFPYLKQQGGSVINFGTRQGIYGEPFDGIYGANKEGIRALSRSAAREWGQHNIRINVINPAGMSPAAEKHFAEHPERAKQYLRDIALGHMGNVDTEIAPIALFLASEDAKYLTGQTINADGGQIML